MKQPIHQLLTWSLILVIFSCVRQEDKGQIGEQNTEENYSLIQVSEEQFERNKMTLTGLTKQNFPTTVVATGTIGVPPAHEAVIHSSMGGYIKTINLMVGDKVKQGQPLVTIENPEFIQLQQKYLEIKEQLPYLKAEYERQNAMQSENITSQKSYLQAESAYKAAEARWHGLREQLKMLNISPNRVENGLFSPTISIYAPLSGVVAEVHVTQGAYVAPAKAIMAIINNTHNHLELSVFEKDILKLREGQNIRFRVPESSSEVHQAKVALIGSNIEENRTVKVHGEMESDIEVPFMKGMFVEAEIITASDLTHALPSESIITQDKNAYVLIMVKRENDVYFFRKQRVKVKQEHQGFSNVQMENGIDQNAQFLVQGAYALLRE
jgi:cobalt-zinc-cadmium efflux system membrane fusion protein